MSVGRTSIIELTTADIVWPFENKPYVLCGGGRWPRREIVDPFPCYSFDRQLVQAELDRLQTLWPLPFDLHVYLLGFETASHTNGWYSIDVAEYVENGKPGKHVGSISLLGKRVPIHPAVQRYAVAHEYGHAAEDAVSLQRGLTTDSQDVLNEYRSLRGLEKDPPYGGGTWHQQACEIFANDFRILIACVETGFWPHPGVPRPEELEDVMAWWRENASKTNYAEEKDAGL